VTRADSIVAAAALFKALASPSRLAIMRELEAGPACVHELVAALGASQSLVSQHLRVLRNVRLVQGARRGKEIEYSVIDTHISRLIADAVAHVAEQEATPRETAVGDQYGMLPASPDLVARRLARREHP